MLNLALKQEGQPWFSLNNIAITGSSQKGIACCLPVEKIKSLSISPFNRKLLICLQKGFILAIYITSINYSLSTLVFCQKAPDSLLILVNTSKGTDRVDALNNLAEFTLRYSVKDATSLLKQAREMSENLDYTFGKARTIQITASLYANKGENLSAIKLASKAASMFEAIREYEFQFSCLLIQGNNYYALGNSSKEIDFNLQALHLAVKLRRPDLQSSALAHLSQNFIKLDDKINALDYAAKGLLLSRKCKHLETEGFANLTMANYWSKFGQSVTAKVFYQRALRLFSISKLPASLSNGYVKYGHHFIKTHAYDSALLYYNKALKIDLSTNEILKQASTLTFIAHVHQLKHEYMEALKYEKTALKLRKEYGNLWLSGSTYSNIGTAYSKINDFPNAMKYFEAGLKIAKAINRIDYIKYTYQCIYDLYVSRKDFKKALEYNLLISAINDSILRIDIQRKFSEIKAKHNDEQKQRAIGFLTKENEIQKTKLKQTNLTVYILALALFLIITISVLLMFQARLKARQKQMDIEQNLLRSQMNPHFIFNALVAIQSFIYKKDSSEAAHYLTNFARLIRLVLSNSQEEFVTLKCEIDTLSNYLSLQKLRFDDKFNYSLMVDPSLSTERIKIPPMLAQPFIENAIEHGILGMDSPGFITINFSLKENNILIEVIDNGVGREKGKEQRKKSDKSHESYGTRITEERIHSHNRKYASKLHLWITDLYDENNEPSGTKVLLSIPNHGEKSRSLQV